jgi:lipoprotein NlpI
MTRLACLALLCVSAFVIADDEADRAAALKLLLKGNSAYEKRQYDEAIKDYSACIEKDPKLAIAYQQRGTCEFMKSRFKESVADFDRYLKLEPKKANGHWQRGIALYYLGKYEEGKKQFEGYEAVDTNDVENAVWHLMCAAKKDDLAKARKGIMKIGKDRRVPMMEVYDLFAGTKKPEDIMKAAMAGDLTEEQRKPNLFYAHLYLGLYYDMIGDKKKAIEHLKQASGKYKIGYMGEVARVHREFLEKRK